jgi:probable F420-dependent oxidoreductase
LATQVLVLGYHHPLEIAKRYGTLDQISGGRVVLGLGVGSLRAEFELLGAQFEGRGALADDAIRALRAALSRSTPAYHGTHYAFEDFVVEPHARQARVPLWIGGRTRRSLRRALELGDGWVPFGLSIDELSAMITAAEVPANKQIVLDVGRPLDPLGGREATLRALARSASAGATILNVSIAARGTDHYCDQLHALENLAQTTDIQFDPTDR